MIKRKIEANRISIMSSSDTDYSKEDDNNK